MNRMSKIGLLYWLLFWVGMSPVQAAEEIPTNPIVKKLVFGVYAAPEDRLNQQRFAVLADYLTQSLRGVEVELRLLDAPSIMRSVSNDEVDLLLLNPSLYEEVRLKGSMNGAIATLEVMSGSGVATSELGGVVFTRIINHQISNYQELKGKKIAAPVEDSAGGYRIPLGELFGQNILGSQLDVEFLGGNDAVVSAVIDGKVDAGFVRTGVLESWFQDKGLNPKLLKVIHSQEYFNFPYLVSTSLYPEWPLLVSASLSHELVRDISVALFSIQADDPVARSIGIAGFVPPKDYLQFETLLRELRLPPYSEVPEFSLAEAIHSHPWVFIVGLFAIVGLSVGVVASNLLRNRLQERTERFEDLLYATRAMTWDWDINFDVVDVNDNLAEFLGYGSGDLQDLTLAKWKALLHPKDLARVVGAIEAHLKDDAQLYEVEFRIRHKSGRWVWVLARGRVVKRDMHGNPMRMMGIYTDIDGIKTKEGDLELRRQRDLVLLDLPGLNEVMSEIDFMQHAQELTESLTASKISFIHFLNDDQETIELVAWSKRTLQDYCEVAGTDKHYPLSSAGIWADAARESRPIMVNDYASFPSKKGLPKGHAYLGRLISVPVIEKGRVVMMTGVGNKEQDYTEFDVETVQLVSNEIWRLVKSKRNRIEMLQQKEQYERLVNDLGPDYVVFSYEVNDGCLLYVSENIQNVFGVSANDARGLSWIAAIDWTVGSVERGLGFLNSILSGLEDFNQFEMDFVHRQSGAINTVSISQHVVRDSLGKIVSIDGLAVDVTALKESQRSLQQAAQVFKHAQEGILIADAQGKIIDINMAFTRITGFSKEDVLGENPSILSSGRQSKDFYQSMWEKLLVTDNWQGEIWNRRKNGEVYPQRINITVVRDSQDEVLQFIALFSDISIEKRQQAELEFVAHFDSLTGLPNRVLLTDRLNQAIAYTQRHKKTLVVVFIDLDGFKEVNDKFGHSSGDALLESLAQRFKSTIRQEDTLSRIGGDEFVGVFPDLNSRDEVAPILERLLQDAVREFDYESIKMQVSASIGVVLYDGTDEEVSADLLIRHADQAMYHAKSAGKNQIAYFESNSAEQINRIALHRKKLNEIEQALNNEEFELFYQPKLNVYKPKVMAFEALIRWKKPGQGLIPPLDFLPYLDHQPLGIRLGYWVIERALQQLGEWQSQGIDCSVSVNVAGYQLLHPEFVEQFQSILWRYPQVSQSNLIMELLESSALEDIDLVSSIINQLRVFGVRFAIDDFGSGYASLNYLKYLPVDELKIDQSFIKDIFEQPQSLVILESVISMGNAFNMEVVAEGVETQEHIDLLLKLGVQVLQGYAISRPMEARVVPIWVGQHLSSRDWPEIEVLNRDAVMKLIAILEYRGWIRHLQACLYDNDCEGLELKSPVSCGFGHWLYSKGKQELPSKVFLKIEEMHDQVHVLAENILACKHSSQEQKAKQLFAELKEYGEVFMTLLEATEV